MRSVESIEHFFTCPYCWEEISMLVDPSEEEQVYVEDCEVCCRPIQILVEIRKGEIEHFSASPSQ